MRVVAPLLLGIDCATSYLALALVDPARGVLAASSEDVGRDHAALIVSALEALFAGADARPADVGRLGVGVGPGSYTGVRVALATAKGLARAWGVPLSGTSSLAALAGDEVAPGEEVVAVLDARRGNVYAQHLRRLPTAPGVKRLAAASEPLKLRREELAARFPGVRLVEGARPDAAAVAWAALAPAEARPYYL